MNYPQAIVIAAGILAGAIIAGNLGQTSPDRLSVGSNPRYLIAATPGQKVANAWRVDTRSGQVYRCFATGGMYGAICRQARFFELDHSNRGDADGPDPDSTGYREGDALRLSGLFSGNHR